MENCFNCARYKGGSDQGFCSLNGAVFSNHWCRSFVTIEDLVDEWHEGNSQQTLQAYLGMSEKQYEKWLQGKSE